MKNNKELFVTTPEMFEGAVELILKILDDRTSCNFEAVGILEYIKHLYLTGGEDDEEH